MKRTMAWSLLAAVLLSACGAEAAPTPAAAGTPTAAAAPEGAEPTPTASTPAGYAEPTAALILRRGGEPAWRYDLSE